jgi:hypothetical protein
MAAASCQVELDVKPSMPAGAASGQRWRSSGCSAGQQDAQEQRGQRKDVARVRESVVAPGAPGPDRSLTAIRLYRRRYF